MKQDCYKFDKELFEILIQEYKEQIKNPTNTWEFRETPLFLSIKRQ